MRVFISGSMAVKDFDSSICTELKQIAEAGHTVIVGDADGVDTEVQRFYLNMKYANVVVYASNGKTRNNLGDWQVHDVRVPAGVTGFDFYAEKDKAMAADADLGVMIWDGISRGTKHNMKNMVKQGKQARVYNNGVFTCLNNFDEFKEYISF